MKREKEVKKEVKRSKKGDLYLTIFNLIKKGENPMNISKILNITKQNTQYYINKLKENGLIKKIGYGTWEKTSKVFTSSLGLRADKPLTNLHSLQITIPIISGKIREKDWQLKNKLRNWSPRYKGIKILGGLTLRNNNNRSISIFAKSRNIKDLNEVDNLSFKIRAYIGNYMRQRGVILDIFNAKVTNLNLATEDKEAQSMLRKGEKFELNLLKKAEKIFPKDDIKAKAWIDGSPFNFSAESNDKEWKRWYLGMPFMIRDMFILQESMTEKIAYIAENYKSHVGIVKEAHNIFKKINKQLKQTSLRKWL